MKDISILTCKIVATSSEAFKRWMQNVLHTLARQSLRDTVAGSWSPCSSSWLVTDRLPIYC